MFRGVTFRKLAILVLKFLIAGALIGWMLSTGAFDLNLLATVLTPIKLAILSLFTFLLIFTNALRWRVLLAVKGLNLKIREVTQLALIGVFFNLALPGGMGGDVLKGYYVIKEHPQFRSATIVSIFIDRILGIYILILTAALAVVFEWGVVVGNPALEAIAWSTFSLALVFTALLGFSFSRKLKNWPALKKIFAKIPFGQGLRAIYLQLHSYRDHPKTLLVAIVASLASQTFQILCFICVCGWLGAKLTLVEYFFIVPVGLVATSVPISPAGIGVGQVAFYYLFNLILGIDNLVGPTSITAFQVTQMIWGIVGALFYLKRKVPNEVIA